MLGFVFKSSGLALQPTNIALPRAPNPTAATPRASPLGSKWLEHAKNVNLRNMLNEVRTTDVRVRLEQNRALIMMSVYVEMKNLRCRL